MSVKDFLWVIRKLAVPLNVPFCKLGSQPLGNLFIVEPKNHSGSYEGKNRDGEGAKLAGEGGGIGAGRLRKR